MRIIAIDPGHTHSAYVVMVEGHVREFHKMSNEDLMVVLPSLSMHASTLVIEQVACMGMAVGAEVFETVFWSGRFAQAWAEKGLRWDRIKRHQVKMHLCGNMRAKDANIRQALIDLFGGKSQAIGNKKQPGHLYGMAGDEWAALAVAVTYEGLHARKELVTA